MIRSMEQTWQLERREMLVSRRASIRYGLDGELFAYDGRVILADFRTARRLAADINSARAAAGRPEHTVQASEINAAGLLHEAMHVLIDAYLRQVNSNVFAQAMADLQIEVGYDEVERTLETFSETFPVRRVRSGELSPLEYLEGATDGRPNREIVLEEMLLLWLANINPALDRLRELFSDEDLARETPYLRLMQRVQDFFRGEPGLGGAAESLVDMLRAPAVKHPGSLQAQLSYISQSWGVWLKDLMARLLGGSDFLAEEHRPVFPPGPGPARAPSYSSPEDEAPEAFSSDLDWMPRVVLLAKNTYVWLAQMGDEYGRHVQTLDQVPDAELDRIAGRGVTGLWLIGLWERSRASAKIKQWMGDHDAAASAYSLYDYVVAADLGGQQAFDDLKERAWQRGIRITTDMVPNHVGIDGRWLIEHPDWFIGLPECPFPAYSFTGDNLADDSRVAVHIEDGYWNRSDAAVVFKRVDRWTGDVKYIYHGNDGTSMPWNDTAQLDYRKAEVREAVIQTILHVARLSPIIRFDAAMTLTRRNFQRLWFPEPGSGGDIPSRAGFGMSREEFDRMMPVEFWREVVDRVAAEAPDTLLLAEAFWMLEGYFVRSLGMHRVYNSAFMNMLRDEKNSEYRKLIRNTLEYDPRILSRYVNFMSNPDEETAVEQFGRDDKYFGICTLMATMPGLPMLGHGQVEGFAEKYGMEFRRPRWPEQVNQGLVDRHELQIFPLLRDRQLFAGVERFRLYDFADAAGGVNEDVFAYSNDVEGRRSLVVYHNRFADTSGWIHRSVPFVSRPGIDGAEVSGADLREGLRLADGDENVLAFRDAVSGLEYLRPVAELRNSGLFVQLGAYQLHVFLDFKELPADAALTRLMDRLGGRGTASIEDDLKDLEVQPVLEPWRNLLDVLSEHGPSADTRDDAILAFIVAARRFAGDPGPSADLVMAACDRLDVLQEDSGPEHDQMTGARPETDRLSHLGQQLVLAAWTVARALDFGTDPSADNVRRAAERCTTWRLGRALEACLRKQGVAGALADQARLVLQLLFALHGWLCDEPEAASGDRRSLAELLGRDEVMSFLSVHTHGGRRWFLKERAEALINWLELLSRPQARRTGSSTEQAVTTVNLVVSQLSQAVAASKFDFDELLDMIEDGVPT